MKLIINGHKANVNYWSFVKCWAFAYIGFAFTIGAGICAIILILNLISLFI